MQKTYIMLKPDAVKRNLMGKIISRIEDKGFSITAMKMITLNTEIIEEHYSNVKQEPFFPKIMEYMISGPVVAMIVEGEDVIQGMRILMGKTKWLESDPGTIRGDFACNNTYNLIHGSDAVETAEIEIKRFFPELY